MKKFRYLLPALLIMGIASIVFVSTPAASSQKNTAASAQAMPDNVAVILKNSCASCHNAGGGMAASIWNFSSWDKYNAKKQAKKAKAMCKAITNSSMPPASVGTDRIPSAAQKDIICNWANSLQVKK